MNQGIRDLIHLVAKRIREPGATIDEARADLVTRLSNGSTGA
jgi:hypothetical protein